MEKNRMVPADPSPFPENWQQMNGDEKYNWFAAGYVATEGKEFESPEIAEQYRLRAQRILDVIALKEPDEVPVYLLSEGFDLENAGIRPVDAFYDHESYMGCAWKMHEDFDLDYSILTFMHSGPAYDKLGMELIRWPGSSLPGALPDNTNFQYVEAEYMPDTDYDELINNPEGYMVRKYIPRTCRKLAGLELLPNPFHFVEASTLTGSLLGLGPGMPARKALETLLSAADDCHAAMMSQITTGLKIRATFGAPAMTGGTTFVPFDLIGDTMRCTVGVMKDLFRHPDKVVAAAEKLVPMAVQMGVQTAYASRVPFVLVPLHKGADGFMSPAQYEKFYWPSLKATFMGLIDAGLIPVAFVEGGYNQRLDIMAGDPLPVGKSLWIFDRTDMKAAKEKIGNWGCISGNVPASLFKHASVEEIEKYCKDLIETCGEGGGFCLAPGAVVDQANPENVRAYLGVGRKYGRYR